MTDLNDFCKKCIEDTLSWIFISEANNKNQISEIMKKDIYDVRFAIKCMATRWKDSPVDQGKYIRLNSLADVIDEEIKKRRDINLFELYDKKFNEITQKMNDILNGPDYPEGIKLFNEAKNEFDGLKGELNKS